MKADWCLKGVGIGYSWVYVLSLWKGGIKSKCQILLQPKMFLFKQKLGNKMTKAFACILIFNSAFLQSEILYAANTILTHLSFFLLLLLCST